MSTARDISYLFQNVLVEKREDIGATLLLLSLPWTLGSLLQSQLQLIACDAKGRRKQATLLPIPLHHPEKNLIFMLLFLYKAPKPR